MTRSAVRQLLFANASLLVPLVSTVVPAQQRVFSPVGIDSSGVRDVTSQLNAFFASVPDGATIQFPAGAKFRSEGTLELVGRHSLTIDGNGALIFATTDGATGATDRPSARRRAKSQGGRSHWAFIGGRAIIVRNVHVRGANARGGTELEAYRQNMDAQNGFDILGAVGVELDRVRVTHVYGDFVYLGADRSTKRWSDSIFIHDSHFERNGRQGIGIAAARNVLIERNYIGHVRRSALDFEPLSVEGGAVDVIVRANTFGPGRLLFIASRGRGERVRNISILGNRLIGQSMSVVIEPPPGVRRGPIRIIRNTSDATHSGPTALMRFTRVDGLEVRGNSNPLAATRARTGIEVVESCAVIVSGNEFVGAMREAEIAPFNCAKGSTPSPLLGNSTAR
jgi:hypothetical protein